MMSPWHVILFDSQKRDVILNGGYAQVLLLAPLSNAHRWHCIVGRNFGSYVTHETKNFIYFYLGQVAILLFKSG